MVTKTGRSSKGEHAQLETEVCLRIMGHDLDPLEISRLLELEPTAFHARGDQRTGASGKRYSQYTEGLWAWAPGVDESEPVAEHLRMLVDVLERKATLLQRLRKLGLRMDIFIGLFGPDSNFGVSLSADLLERLGRLGVDLDFDIYCS